MPLRVRRFVPQIVLVAALCVALAAGGVGAAMGVARHNQGSHTPVILHWGNEGTSDLMTLDPAQGIDLNARLAAQVIFGGLVRFGPKFHILPDVARSWTITDRGRVYTFYLRPQARFADGTEATAADVAYSLNRTVSKQFAQGSGAFFLSGIQGAPQTTAGRTRTASGITVVNRHTLRIRLQAADSSFLSKLATPAGYIISPAEVRRDPAHWSLHAYGTGPFAVRRWVRNSGLLLLANPFYWQGRPRIDGIDMPFIPEPLAAYKRYRSGSLDVMGAVQFPTEALYDVRGQSGFHAVSRPETVFLSLNVRTAPFNSSPVRQAFADAIDKASIARTIFAGFAHPTNVMIPPGIPGYNPSVSGVGYNPAAARRLLAQAGYPGGRGFPHVLYAVDQDAQHLSLATHLAAQWRRVLGVSVDVEQYAHAPYLSVLSTHAYGIAGIDWTVDYPDPANFLTQQLHTGSPNNNSGWSDPLFDLLTDEAATMSPSDPVRLVVYHRAEEMAMQQAADIPLVNPLAGILIRPGIRGLQLVGGDPLAQNWTQVTVSQSATP